MIRSLALALVLAALPGLAAAQPALRAAVEVTGDVVRIGDLVSEAGDLADIAVFRSPDPGHTGSVPAGRVLDAARRHGLGGIATGGIAEVAVTRLARVIAAGEIEAAIAAALAARRGADPENLSLSFDRPLKPLAVEPSAGALTAVPVSLDAGSGRFEVALQVAGSAIARGLALRYGGRLVDTVPVAVLARPLERGDVIRASDIAIERRPRTRVPAGALGEAGRIVGLAARRPLRAAQMLRPADLMKPELVRQNELVTVVYEAAGLTLSVRGQALGSGAAGETVNVLNVHSRRTVQGVVIGPARVAVLAAAPPAASE